MNQNNCAAPELLYFGYGDTPSHGMHSHDFYQIEFCIEGNIPAVTDLEKITLEPAGSEQPFTIVDGRVEFSLNKLVCHQMIVLHY